MDNLLFLDTETYCETPISHGTHAYAEDAEVMVVSWAHGMEDPPKVADLTAGEPFPLEVRLALQDPGTTIVGQNFGNFDRTVLRYALGIEIPPERIHDTMVQAMCHGLPGGLEILGEIFGVSDEDAKMKEGKALIQLFCKPRPKNQKLRRATRETHPEEWAKFLEYAKSDISSMRHIFRKMPRWNYPGEARGNRLPEEFALWCLDQRINDRGFFVDLSLADGAVEAVNKAQKALNKRTSDMTEDDVQRATQRDRLIRHVMAEFNIPLPDLTKSTLERRIEDPDLPEPVRELLAIRLEASQTSTSKYNRLRRGVNSDGRLRGTLQFSGATRTGRWAGRVFQPQNLPRPSMPNAMIETGIEALKQGYADVIFDSPIALASNALRGTIIAEPGRKLVVADLSNIEGRVLAWLAGEAWKLQAFRDYDNGDGPDLYYVTAADVTGKHISHVTKDDRQMAGKVPELACGYQGALGAFQAMAAAFGLEVEEDEVWRIVRGWRHKNSRIVEFWWELQEAAWSATQGAGTQTVGKIEFEKWRNWLKMHLPSGRILSYADPVIMPDPRRKGSMTLGYMGLNSYTKRWERLTTYGGKLAENATQAVARDVIASSMEPAEEAGFPIILTVHDELITEPPDEINYSVDKLAGIMATTPWWADEDLPLAAAGFEGYRYRKD